MTYTAQQQILQLETQHSLGILPLFMDTPPVTAPL